MSPRAITTRPYAAGDEDTVRRLYEDAFGDPLSAQTWSWKYAASPWSDLRLCRVAVDERGDVVAHIGVVPVPLNVSGAQHRAGVIADFVVARSSRALGLDRTLFVEAHQAMHARRLVAGLSFPSDLAVAPLHHQAARVAMLEKYHLVVGGAAHARLRARFEATPADEQMILDLDPHYTLDGRYDALWASCRKQESLALWKDRRYLEWKYLQRPGARAQMMALKVGEALGAVCVLAPRRYGALVLELVARDKSVELGRQLMLRVADHAAATGVGELRFIGHDPWFFGAVLAELDRRPAYTHHVFVRAADPDLGFLYQNPINWTLTAGDHDAI